MAIRPPRHSAGIGTLSIMVAVPLLRYYLPGAATEHDASPARRCRLEPALLLLAGVGFAALLAEGAVADWSAVFLSETQSASPLAAARGYAAFRIAMSIGRVLGDRLVERLGRSRSVAAATGIGPGTGGQAVVVAGLCLLGLGIAVVVPVVMATGADGPGIATVASGGCVGWLLGPAVIGGLGEWLGLTGAMWVIPVLALVVSALARSASPRCGRPAGLR